MKMSKKAQSGVDMLGVVVIGFVIAGITIAVGSKVVADVQATMTAGSTAALAASNTTYAINNIATNLPLLGTVAALVIVIGFVVLLKRNQ